MLVRYSSTLMLAGELIPLFVQGKGSNLTFEGQTECEASLMDGLDGVFGGVGAIHCEPNIFVPRIFKLTISAAVKNPICAARAVLNNTKKPQPLGRVPPLFVILAR